MDFNPSTAENVVSLFGPIGGSAVAVVPGATTLLTSTPMDMRAYSGYYLSVLIRNNGGLPANPQTGQILMEFVSDPSSTASVFVDAWEAFAFQGGGAFNFSGDVVEVNDNIHGPYVKLSVKNTSAAGNLDFVYNMFGTSRSFPGQAVKHRDTVTANIADGQLLASSDGVNAGVTLTKQCRLGSGRGFLSWNTGAAFTIALYTGSQTTNPYTSMTVPVERNRMFITLPKRGMLIQATNNGANSFIDLHLANEYTIIG